ncbi:MAG: biopolymer transporter ExbD [Nostoc sp.]|uniref:ExbD/TolR family protein n=1 Tax=unclassified Nostoc TaxID=2593658 RepID=UPI0025CF383C|nr:biopolymer transporter ExbD [Nostoc sp. NMS9]MBN3944585.1 biopolymer transporter ExbD [Nostoc sp. NMS9]
MDLDDNEPDLAPFINVVPLIDVMFALLTFFIMSTLFLTRSEGLPVNLPKAATAKEQQIPTKVTITVDEKGQVSLNRDPIAVNDVAARVRTLVGSNPDTLVIINADQKVLHGEIVGIMDQVRQVKGARLAIATQR